ncbi:beta family protein [Cupriavidus pauculus]|uniref:beta family protein n=1 Tax=Cupriavidus pauculus TaxID=82633 RepID=UPI001EE36230|nr:beta family protein [Cupriavidus pauculus]GJG93878.1 beta family protein [Cupriavidus pauculus]
MSLKYVPVMAAKRGEFTALANLRTSISEKIIPVFELPSKKPEAIQHEKKIARTAIGAGKAWANRLAFLDISKWSPDARTESGIHVLEFAFGQFRTEGVVVQPVVGYDRWDDPAYSLALKNIRKAYQITPCIRLDLEAIKEDLGDLVYFEGRMQEILDGLDVGPENCYVMVDFGDVSKTAVPDIIQATEDAVQALRSMGFGPVVVVGGSMPAGVNEAVDAPDTEGCIPRIEMWAWKAVFSGLKDEGIVFGDYLIRSPKAAEGVIAPDANGKIRYTIENQTFIVRGHTKRLDSLTVQHKDLAQKLVASAHYMGPSFSWGDSELLNCSLGLKELRESTVMIAVDSNHHIHTVVAEVSEHQSKVLAAIATTPENIE